MNKFELKTILNELESLQQFAATTTKFIKELLEENEILRQAISEEKRNSSVITIKEIANDIKVSPQTVINFIKSGLLKGEKKGKRWIVLYEDYLKFKKTA